MIWFSLCELVTDCSRQSFRLHNLVAIDLQTTDDVAEGGLRTQGFHVRHLRCEGEAHLVTGDDRGLARSTTFRLCDM
jgi:hypothetical protein